MIGSQALDRKSPNCDACCSPPASAPHPPGIQPLALLLPLMLFHHPAIANNTSAFDRMQRSTVRIICEPTTSTRSLYGSGFVVGIGDGSVTYLATNHHVAFCAETPSEQHLSVVREDGNMATAAIVWDDATNDLAILSSPDPPNRPSVTLANTTSVAVGDPVVAVGFPHAADLLSATRNLATPSVTPGTITRIDPARPDGARQFQHNADTAGGSSGGPLFDAAGAVIGINTLKAAAPGDGVRGLTAAVDVAALLPGLTAQRIPYTMETTVTSADVANVLLLAALLMLAAAGTVLVATAPGRAWLQGLRTGFGGSPRRAAQGGHIRITGGSLAGMEVPVAASLVLGRDPSLAQIVFPIDDRTISRRHCEIRFDPGAAVFEIRDLGSRNGTFLAGSGEPRRLSADTVERVPPGQKVLVGSPHNSLVLELG